MAKNTGKKFVTLVVFLVLIGLAVPVINLIVGLPESETLAAVETGDPVHREALDIMGKKCSNCHTQDYLLPWYAKMPIAKGVIERDIQMGLEFMDMPYEFTGDNAEVPNEAALAKIEYTLEAGTMPPKHYLLVHWDGGVSGAERQVLDAYIASMREAHYAVDDTPKDLIHETVRPLPASFDVDPAKAALGEKLYHDVRLSGDDTLSCASCHDLALGGTDQVAVSIGVGGAEGPINAPTVYNAMFNLAQFWDGRATDLQDQAGGPVENPIEMAATFPNVIAKLNQDEAFKAEFEAVYPQGFTKETITDAIAEFETTLVTPGSPYDNYLEGDQEALTDAQKRGLELYAKHGCAMCHVGEAMGGQSFEKMGRYVDYFADRGGEITEADLGRYNHTGEEKDKHKFKVPVLRNVEVTFPYFHDASTSDLGEAVRVMANVQMDKDLSQSEVDDLAAFLESLTGAYQGTPLDEM